MQPALFMLSFWLITLLLDGPARLTFSLLVRIANVGRCGSHQLLASCGGNALGGVNELKKRATNKPRRSPIPNSDRTNCMQSPSYHLPASADPLPWVTVGRPPAKCHRRRVLCSTVALFPHLKSAQVQRRLHDLEDTMKINKNLI